jgi:hypothetical protein
MTVALLILLIVGAVVAVGVRSWQAVRKSDADGALALMEFAAGRLPASQLEWSLAMRAEFAALDGRWARWRFALGCLHGSVASTRRQDAGSVRRHGIVGGLVVGVLFVVAASPPSHVGYAAAAGVVLAILAAVKGVRANGDPTAGIRIGLWIGAISGLVFFGGLLTMAHAAAGWYTYNGEAVAVFNNFGPVTERGHNLAQWPGFDAFIVRRETGVAVLFGVVGVPLLGVATGLLGGVLGRGSRRRSRSALIWRGRRA